jgi:hypothetical protein
MTISASHEAGAKLFARLGTPPPNPIPGLAQRLRRSYGEEEKKREKQREKRDASS